MPAIAVFSMLTHMLINVTTYLDFIKTSSNLHLNHIIDVGGTRSIG